MMNSAQLMGLVSALKTGDPTVDMILAMILPLLFASFYSQASKLIGKIWNRSKPKVDEGYYTRSIAFRVSESSSSSSSSNVLERASYNYHLIRAIKLYIHRNCKLELVEADIELMAIDPNRASPSVVIRDRSRKRLAGSNATARQLEGAEVIEKPVAQAWHRVGVYDGHAVSVYFSDSNSTGLSKKNEGQGGSGDGGGAGNGGKSVRSIEVQMRSKGPSSIGMFVHTAYDWFLEQLEGLEENDRYMFDVTNLDAPMSHGNLCYDKYKLGDDKTFETLFSQKCEPLRRIVDQFQAKEGKYKIKGYPHKLGLLLSGPPGTGKTSLIKALAQHTDRHIVQIPLDRIKSNTQLMKVFFNKRYQATGSGEPMDLDFKDVIFVLEDVDAATDVVLKRKTVRKQQVRGNSGTTNGSTDGRDKDLERATRAVTLYGEPLNLSGLLNVLDGVVETPGRIVVMTSNHPDKLDPALIRPGRIDKQLVLGYMEPIDLANMLEHYYEVTLAADQKQRIEDLLLRSRSGDEDRQAGIKVTPAQVEQMAVVEDTVDGFLAALASQHRHEESSSCASVSDAGTDDTGEASSSSSCSVILPLARGDTAAAASPHLVIPSLERESNGDVWLPPEIHEEY